MTSETLSVAKTECKVIGSNCFTSIIRFASVPLISPSQDEVALTATDRLQIVLASKELVSMQLSKDTPDITRNLRSALHRTYHSRLT